jgi:ABC-type Fe3+/spermidine/putrescine transport system ATPase subunit
MDRKSATNSVFLKLDGVVKQHGARRVVNQVSFEAAEGEILALLGPSGCGKTTLLRLIAGLDKPDEGEIWIDGEQMASPGRNIIPPHQRRIGFVFQDLALWPHLTVEGNLEFVLASMGVPKHERKLRMAETLDLTRASAFSRRHPGELSGGEQQRAAIARALVGLPRLLLLDEPMSGLDADLKFKLLEEISALQQAMKITTLLVTHDQAEARAFARLIIWIREGCVEQISTIAPVSGEA